MDRRQSRRPLGALRDPNRCSACEASPASVNVGPRTVQIPFRFVLQVFQITSYWRIRFKRQNRTWVCSGIPVCLRGMPDYFYRARFVVLKRYFGGVVATIADAAGRDLGSACASLSSTRAAERPGHGIHGSLAAAPPKGVVRRRVRRPMTISNRAPRGSTRGSRLTWLVVGTFARTGPEVSRWTASPRARPSPSSVSQRATTIVVARYRIQE
jgi:hypothetical protein